MTQHLEKVLTLLTTQTDGAMPHTYQLNVPSSQNFLGTKVFVDPRTAGIKVSDKFKAANEIVETKTVRLSAGDHIELNYIHNFGRGIRLDKLHGLREDGSTVPSFPYTYTLMVEAFGEKVECYNAALPNAIYKGTCVGTLAFEFSRRVEGISDSRNTIDNQAELDRDWETRKLRYQHMYLCI